jgi:uncharacterized protein (UPF0333 family)
MSHLKSYIIVILGCLLIGFVVYLMNVENGISLKYGLIYIAMILFPMIGIYFKMKKKENENNS